MRIEYVELAGFRGFRDKVRVDFGSGFTVITGRNGVGKSTIVDAIDYALTGSINKFKVQTAKGGGLAEHIWWVGEGASGRRHVSLGVVDLDGKQHSLTRFDDGSVIETEPFETILINAAKGQQIGLRNLATTMILRDELISEYSLDLSEQARFSAVLDAIAPETGPDLAKKVADVSALAAGRLQDAKTRLERLQSRLTENLEHVAQARNMAAQSPSAESALSTLRSFVPDLPADIASRRKRVGEFLAQLRLDLSVVADSRPRILSFAESVRALETEGVSQSVASLVEQITPIEASIAELDGQLKEANKHLEAAEAENAQLTHLAMLVEHGEAYGLDRGHCPLCAATRSAEEFAKAIAASKEKLSEAGNKVAAASKAASELNEKRRNLQQQLQLLQRQHSALTARIEAVQTERTALTRMLTERGCQVDPTDIPAIDRWLLDSQERQIRIQEALVALDSTDITDRIVTIEKTSEELRSQIDSLSGAIVAREIEANLAKKVEELTKEFPNQILAEQFDAVMPLLKEFYRRLRPHTDWDEIEYDFGGRIKGSLNFYVADHKNPQFLFSSGQRRATGLAFLLAVHLSRHWANLATLILDDPVQHIDDYRALNLVEVLATIRRTGHQIIVSVEDPALARLLARRLRVSQDQHGAYYELGTDKHGSTCVLEEFTVPPLPSTMLQQAS